MPSASSSEETTLASMFHSLESTPDENGQLPLSTIAAVDFAGAAGRKDKGGRDQRVGVLVPDQVLGALVEHAEHPVMAGEIGEIPRHRRIALPERVGAIDQRDVIEFGATDPLRLHDPEQAGVMQIAFGLRRQTAQFLGSAARDRAVAGSALRPAPPSPHRRARPLRPVDRLAFGLRPASAIRDSPLPRLSAVFICGRIR